MILFKKTIHFTFILFVSFTLFGEVFLDPAEAGTPHIIYGNVVDAEGSIPSDGSVKFKVYVSERPDEILTEIHVPNAVMGGGIHTKFALRETDLAVVSVATYLTLKESSHDECDDIRIVMGSVNPFPFRVNRAEEAIRGQKITDALIEKTAQAVSEDIEPTADLNGTEEFKRDITRVLIQRAIKEAVARARTI